jgi:tetratricopeptide (TPR) repeat protein
MTRVSELAPNAMAPLVNAAVAYERLGRIEDARRSLEQAARAGEGGATGGRDETLRTNAAAIALRLGALGAARTQLELARQHRAGNVSSPVWYHYSSVLAARQGDLQAAAAILEQGVAMHRSSPGLLSNLAAVRLLLGNAEGALACAEAALAENAAFPQVRYNRAAALAALGRAAATPGHAGTSIE